jgi:hypothetical protein
LHQGNFDAEMSLSPDSLAELHWWVNNIGAANKKVYQASPDVILYTDASGAGWGQTLRMVSQHVASGHMMNLLNTLIA